MPQWEIGKMSQKLKSDYGRVFVAAAICCAAVGLASAPLLAKEAEGGLLEFTKKMVDFGRIAEGERPATTFEFVNKSKADVRIHEVRTDCLCTSVEHSEKPIRPGQNGAIEVTLRSKGRKGEVRSKIVVRYASAGEDYQDVLELRAEVHQEGKLVAEPEAFELETILAETPVKKRFVVKNADTKVKTNVLKVDSPSWLEVRIGKRAHKQKWILSATGTLPDRPGALNEKIIVHTDNKTFPTLTIPVTAEMLAVVVSDPGKAWMEVDPEGAERSITVRIVDKRKRKISKTELARTKAFRELLNSVEIKDGSAPWEKVLIATLSKGLPKKRVLILNTTLKATVAGKEYVVPINLMFIKRRPPKN